MTFHCSLWATWKPAVFAAGSLIGTLFLLNILPNTVGRAYAQTTSPITSSGLSTTVTQTGTTYTITGGTRPGGGLNLFHSFGEFGVPTDNIANFLNETALPTSNILARVTGGNISNIFGTIQTTGFGNANLFLMNPAGFLFGPNATVNVGGMVAFTSADYLRLSELDGSNAGIFHADPGQASVLTSAPVAAFGFLGSNPGAITVQGSQFTVSEGQGISLVGGNIDIASGTLADGTFQPARLTAPGGQINLASVASPGEVSMSNFMPAPGMTMGSVTLSQGTTLDVSADAAGSIKIRGGQIVIADATLSADTGNVNGAPVAIDINATGDLSITDTRAMSAITATTSGTGNAGAVQIAAANVEASTTSQESFTLIDTHTSGDGRAGNVTIATHAESATGNLLVSGTVTTGFTFIDSGTRGPGTGGDVTLTAKNIDLNQTTISTGDFVARQLYIDPSGSAGNLTIAAESLRGRNFIFSTEGWAAIADTQQGGNITITGRQDTPATISLLNGQVSAGGALRGGDITFTNFNSLFTDFTFFETFTVFGQGGGITANGRSIELTNGSKFVATTFGDGDAGNISLTATDHVSLLGQTPDNPNPLSVFSPTGLFSNSFGDLGLGNLGAAGNIEVTTPRLVMDTGARINAITSSSGRGGDVTITADVVSISGEFTSPSYVIEGSIVDIGDFRPSGIFTRTIGAGESCTGSCGAGGNITMTVGSLTMGSGSQLDAGTSSTGNGGSITVNARETISMSGTLIDGSPVGIFSRTTGTDPGSGNGGNIELRAAQIEVTNGAHISAATSGTGNAGSISILGPSSPAQSVLIDGVDSGIFTDTEGTGAGGNIFVNANTVTLQNGGTLSAKTSGTEATATGGTITVNADQIQLNNQASITATSSGAGNAGTITMTAVENIVLLDNSSIASAAEGEGNGGLVSLTAPSIEMHGSSNILTSTAGLGNAGNIELQGNQVTLTESFITARTQAEGHGGNITIRGLTGEGSRATDVTLSDNSQLVSETIGDGVNIQGAAGNILIETARLNLSSASQLNTASRGSTGAAGNITINATDSLTISGPGTQLFSGSTEFSFGDAGHITITAPSVMVENGGGISTSTSLLGNAGTITVNTNNLQLLSGGHITSSSLVEFPEAPPSGAAGTVAIQGLATPAQSVLIDGFGSGIFTDTEGTGAGGNIFVNANTVTLQNGGTLSATTAGTSSTATGGTILIEANQVQLNNGGLITTSTTGAGAGGSITIGAGSTFASNASTVSSTAAQAQGGDITITAGESVTLNNGSLITASSSGLGNAGNILINAGQNYTSTDSAVTTQAAQASGGNITVLATDMVHLTNSQLDASVQGSSTTVGGNITIDPQYVILLNSQILAEATQGQGGAISINITNGGLYLPDATSTVSASSQFGVSGSVTIQSPNAPASGKIQPLGKSPLQATSLLNQRCAALAGGEFSSFTVAGRDSVPTEPGNWLASQPALGPTGFSAGIVTEGDAQARLADPADETTLLSLRQIAPAGFLTQSFAVERSSGCQS
ncbi:MAG: hypothetical protein RL042_1006 [Nitrospirota bacterium]|jgi:filamentous hemagglutinin family protein